MSNPALTPVGDTVPKVDDELAVGEDLDFQRRWWRFERVVWAFFLVVIVCDLVGLFGHGPLAEATASTPDKSLSVDYERVARANTPSMITLHFGYGAIRDGQVSILMSDSIFKDLGAQRIVPQPAATTIGEEGVTYSFPATSPAAVRIHLQPALPARPLIRFQLPDQPPVEARVLVLP